MKLIVEAPINSLSLGNVSYNLLRELYKTNADVALFPIGNIDVSSFQVKHDFFTWIQKSLDQRFSFLNLDLPALKIWHLNGSDTLRSRNQNLITFYETNSPTNIEKQICKFQTKTFFSSTYASSFFENSDSFKLGFDEDFFITNKSYFKDRIHFGISGKFEKRKHTEKLIKTWLKKYGNNNKYLLSCCITNPFFKPEDMNRIIHNILEGRSYSNINFLPWLRTNAEVNEFLNSIDIDLTGMSGGEGWNLPSFNATCLGKWSLVLNATAHKDWANIDNCILVEPDGEQDAEDGVFFAKNAEFNQGTFYNFSEDKLVSAMELAETKVGQFNTSGSLMSQTYTYKSTLDKILSSISLA